MDRINTFASSHSTVASGSPRHLDRIGATLKPQFIQSMSMKNTHAGKRTLALEHMDQVKRLVDVRQRERRDKVAAAAKETDFAEKKKNLEDVIDISRDILEIYEAGKTSLLACKNLGGQCQFTKQRGQDTLSQIGKKMHECWDDIKKAEMAINYAKAMLHHASKCELDRKIEACEERPKNGPGPMTANSGEVSSKTSPISDTLKSLKKERFHECRELARALRKLPLETNSIINIDEKTGESKGRVYEDALNIGCTEFHLAGQLINDSKGKYKFLTDSYNERINQINAYNSAENLQNATTISGENKKSDEEEKSSWSLQLTTELLYEMCKDTGKIITRSEKMAALTDDLVLSRDRWKSFSRKVLAMRDFPKGGELKKWIEVTMKFMDDKKCIADQESHEWMINAFLLSVNAVYLPQQMLLHQPSEELIIPMLNCRKNLHYLSSSMMAYQKMMTDVRAEEKKNKNSDPNINVDHKILVYTYTRSYMRHLYIARKNIKRLTEKLEKSGGNENKAIATNFRNIMGKAISNLITRTEVLQAGMSNDLRNAGINIHAIKKMEHEEDLDKNINWEEMCQARQEVAYEKGPDDGDELPQEGMSQASSSATTAAQAEQAAEVAAEKKMWQEVNKLPNHIKKIKDEVKRLQDEITSMAGDAAFLKDKIDKASFADGVDEGRYFSDGELYEQYMNEAANCTMQQEKEIASLRGNGPPYLERRFQELIAITADAEKRQKYENEKERCKKQCEEALGEISEMLPKGGALAQEAKRLKQAVAAQRISWIASRPSQLGFNWLATNGYIASHPNAAPQYLPDPKKNKLGYLMTDKDGNADHDHVLQYEVRAIDAMQETAKERKKKAKASTFFIHYHYKEDVYKNLQTIYDKISPHFDAMKKRAENGKVMLNKKWKGAPREQAEELLNVFQGIKANPYKGEDLVTKGRGILNDIKTSSNASAGVSDDGSDGAVKILEEVFDDINTQVEEMKPFLKEETAELEGFYACDFKRAGEELKCGGNPLSMPKQKHQDREDIQIYRNHSLRSNFAVLHALAPGSKPFNLEYHPKRRAREKAPQP